jgi:hypothetical protein
MEETIKNISLEIIKIEASGQKSFRVRFNIIKHNFIEIDKESLFTNFLLE